MTTQPGTMPDEMTAQPDEYEVEPEPEWPDDGEDRSA
jgi:hypothetical protein